MLRWDDKPGAQQAMSELLADITIRHAFEDVMGSVPPNHRDTKFFVLSKKCKAAYDQMERDAILKLKDEVVSAVHAASLRTKLLQIASGAAYSDGEHYAVIDRGRYELIAELVEERDHSIVFFNWRHQRDELCAEFDKRGITFAVIDGATPQHERDRIVSDYQAGSYQALLLHPRTGAHGLTLTRGTTTIVSSPIYEADLLKQAIHRVYRGGQTKATNTILICAQGTVEEKVYARLYEKYDHMNDLLELIQERGK
jgi:SNF2 family DNA or RNA helicase